jgi:hypothetical protein
VTTQSTELCPEMEAVINQLIARHHADLSQPGASLVLGMPTRSERWTVTNLDGERLSVMRCALETADCLGLELDLVFMVHPVGWEPVELIYSPKLWTVYAQEAAAAGTPIYEEAGGIFFARFCEYWAQQIQQQGWLTDSYIVAEVDEDDLPF